MAGIFQEERAFLREKQIEAIEVDLLFVDLDLSKVGVVSSVKCEARCYRVLDIEAEFFVIMGVDGQFATACCLPEHVWRHFEVSLARYLKSLDCTRIGNAIDIVLTRQRRPIYDLIVAAYVALKIDSPGLYLFWPVTQRLERYPHFGAPAEVRFERFYVPARVPVEIETAATGAEDPCGFLDDLAIKFDACGVGTEDESVLFVVKAVQDDLKTIRVFQRRVPATVRGNDLCRLIVETDNADIERVARKSDIDLCSLRRGPPFIRPDLPEAGGRLDTIPGRVAGNLPIELRRSR